jgi:glucose-1-phosphate cytidylyltransferase
MYKNIKIVILAGGFGTRLSEETNLVPKPLVKIGNLPILMHIMKIYSHFGFFKFIICAGYKSHLIKNYFSSFENKNNWEISVIQTGLKTNTAGRLKKIKKLIGNDEIFLMTYGDGVSNINIVKLLEFHIKKSLLVTMTAVKPMARFGIASIKNSKVIKFLEKPEGDSNWVNGGFFVINTKVLDYIKSFKSIWEKDIMPTLAKKRQISAFKHKDFWYSMDTLRDKNYLNNLWKKKRAPWKIW